MKNTLNLIILTLLSFSLHAACIKGNCNNGRGKYKISAEKTYTGDFKAGKPHGKGMIVHTNGMIVKGFWKNGLQHGKSIIETPNGNKLLCYYKNGKKHGKGKAIDADRKLLSIYEWNNGKLISKKDANQSSLNSETKVEEANNSNAEESTDTNPVEEEVTKRTSLNIGEMIHMSETYSYNTGDGSFFGNLMGAVLKVSFHVDFYGIVESKLGDRYKVTITDAIIKDQSWASYNYMQYKPYAQSDANKKIGQTLFVYPDEVNTVDR